MEGTPIELQTPIGDAITKIHFSPRSNHLLISSWDSVLRLYDVDGSALRLEVPSEAALLDCCFQDEFAAFTAGSDCCVRRYDLHSGSEIAVGRHDAAAICIEHDMATGQLVTAGLDKKLIFWDANVKNGTSGCSHMVDLEVESISLSGVFLIAAVGTKINIYDLRNLKAPVQSKASSVTYGIGCVRKFSNCKGYAVGSIDGQVALEAFDSSKACEIGYTFWCHPKSKDKRFHLVRVNDIEFHPSSDNFVTGDNEGYAIIWDAQSRRRLFEFPRYRNSVASLCFNENGDKFAIASSYTYQEANEPEEAPQIYIHEMENVLRPPRCD